MEEKNGKTIGCTDCSADPTSYNKNKLTRVNMIFSRVNQGQGVGKALMEKRADELMNHGYEYVVGSIYSTNQEHIDRLARKGWQQASGLGNENDSEEEDEQLLTFWNPLKPELANQELR